MQSQDLRAKLQNGQISLGSWLQIPSADVAEIIAQCGYDWLVIDMEHGSIDISDLPHLLRAIKVNSYNINPLALVRVPKAKTMYIRRALDAGADGLIFPMIQSRCQLDDAIAAACYPPLEDHKESKVLGLRGQGFCRANGYGKYFTKYNENQAQNLIFVAQIEHIDAINNLEDIITHPRLDAIIIGPYDLSASMQITGQFSHVKFTQALEKIQITCKQANLPFGIHIVHPNPDELKNAIKMKYTFIAYGLDATFLWTMATCPTL